MSARMQPGDDRSPRIPRRTAAALIFFVAVGFAGVPLTAAFAVGSDGPLGGADRPPIVPQFILPEETELAPQALDLSRRYREIFVALSAGDRSSRSETIGRAAALESQALAAHPGKAIEWLNQADGLLLGAYLKAEPQCALPLVHFYQRLALVHTARRSYPLIQRALHVADGLFEQMTREANSKAERRLTADAYAGFAAELLGVPAPARAAEMLGRGVVLAPEDDDSHIALAILLLRDRRANEAESTLDHVLRLHPANREARLRRALMRSGFSADGRTGTELDKLATGGEADWIALVAAQERVRRLLATGDYDKSISFLNRVLERFPGDSSLRVALAFASARGSRRAEAHLASQSALAARAPAGEGARRVFAELPLRLLSEQATRAAAAGEERLPKLSAAIASVAPPSPGAAGAPGAPTAQGLSGAAAGTSAGQSP
jgi:tetratricopeptide (TPR) repeat protein